jgi:nitrite reductase (NADH) small subunit
MTEYRAGSIHDFPEPGARVVHAGRHEIAVFRVEGRLYALDNRCAHLGGPLAEGLIEEGCVLCPWHDWRYRLDDGFRVGPGRLGVATYRVWEADGDVWVRVPRP